MSCFGSRSVDRGGFMPPHGEVNSPLRERNGPTTGASGIWHEAAVDKRRRDRRVGLQP